MLRHSFVIQPSSFNLRHSTFVIRHSQTEIIKNPRNITFYALKPHPTTTQRIVANPWAVGRVTPCAPLLTSQRTSFPNRGHPNASLLRNTLCKCLFLQQVTPAASAFHSSGHVAPGFPLPAVAGRMEKSSATYFRSLLRLVLWKRPRSARTATRRCPGSSRRSRGATLDISQLRSGWARTQGSCASWRDAGVPPSRQDGFGFATNPRHVGGIAGEWSYPEPPPARASGGGRSRAATPFACGAGTLWRRHAHRRPGDFVPRLVCDRGCPPPRRHLGPIRPLIPFQPAHRLANPRSFGCRAPFHRKPIKTPEISLFTL